MSRSCLIIGAGMAGITAASELRRAGFDVSVVEKSHGPGGRMATLRLAGGIFDFGAQFFTVRSPVFQAQIQGWLECQIARVWTHGFARLSSFGPMTTYYPDRHPRYCGVRGMNSIVKYFADEASSAGVRIIYNAKVKRLRLVDRSWTVETESALYSADSVVLTAPLPQSLELLNSSNLFASQPSVSNLTRVFYDRCLSLLVQSDQSLSMPEPGAIAENRPGQPLSFLSDNSRKNISPIPGSLTIHSSAEMADKLFNETDEAIAAQLISCAQSVLGSFKVNAWHLHRWRYSKPNHTPRVDENADRHAVLCGHPAPLIIAGDALSGAKVEGAFLSGLSAAKAVLT